MGTGAQAGTGTGTGTGTAPGTAPGTGATRTEDGRAGPRRGAAGKRRAHKNPTAGEIRKWAEDCPLWRWRAQRRMTRPIAASVLGVSHTSVWQWEHGATRPKGENMARLVDALGPETVERWAEWLARKPTWDGEASGA